MLDTRSNAEELHLPAGVGQSRIRGDQLTHTEAVDMGDTGYMKKDSLSPDLRQIADLLPQFVAPCVPDQFPAHLDAGYVILLAAGNILVH